MRPLSARWFHAVVPYPAYQRAAEMLAASRLVELDVPEIAGQSINDLVRLIPDVARCRELWQRYRAWLPPAELMRTSGPLPSAQMLTQALATLTEWERQSAALRERLTGFQTERDELQHWRIFISACNSRRLNIAFGGMGGLDSNMAAALLVLPVDVQLPDYPDALVVYRIVTDAHVYLLSLGTRQAERELLQRVGNRLLHKLIPPPWLTAESAAALPVVDARLKSLADELQAAGSELQALNERLKVAVALGTIQRIDWAISNLRGMQVDEYLAHIVGWTSDAKGDRLGGSLLDAGIPSVIDFPSAPAGKEPPIISSNPVWAQPFELFVRMLGIPGQNEPDPSRLLTVIAPLLFGYMFGDLGQGAVLIIAGILLRRRWPAMTLLISGGAAAMLFGFLFGTAFCIEGVVKPLWVAPLVSPLNVLFLPILGGAALILLSLVLSGVRAFWSGHIGEWLSVDAGLVTVYVGALLLPLQRNAAIAVIGTGLLWALAGSLLQRTGQGFGAAVSEFVELIERVFQLGINTLSFVRVGAFALAHAGLSLAFVSLAEVASSRWLGFGILVIGNVLILGLEGLIVFVQTTRLILFEFFTRFLTAEGRQFHPSVPPTVVQ